MAREPQKVGLLKKRTVILRTDQIEAIAGKAADEGREFSAQLRHMVDRDLGKRRSAK